jgi:hypothetical protein
MREHARSRQAAGRGTHVTRRKVFDPAAVPVSDRSDISNWVRGTRQGRVFDIEVLTRIADGLRMPDEARVLLGLAPADALIAAIRDSPPTVWAPVTGPGQEVIALPGSGGAARRFHDRARRDPRLRTWMAQEAFAALDACADPGKLAADAGKHHRPGEEFTRVLEDLLTSDHGEPSD